MRLISIWVVGILSLFVTACTTTDKYSFTRLGQSFDPGTGNPVSPWEPPKITDGLAMNYASCVASLVRAKFNGTRVANEVASSLQITLAALAGAGAAFDFGASAVAALGLSSAAVPQLQKIFMTEGRIDAYQDAVRLIEEAEVEYLSYNQYPSSTVLTQNGVTLIQRVSASIHLVEKTLSGRIPTLADTAKATEPMTQAGAVATAPGVLPSNNIPASETSSRLALALNRPVRHPSAVSNEEFRHELAIAIARQKQSPPPDLPSFSQFAATLRTLDNNISADMKTEVYGSVFDQAAISPTPDQFPDVNSAAVGANVATLSLAYRKFPDKQRKLSDLINQLVKKYPKKQAEPEKAASPTPTPG